MNLKGVFLRALEPKDIEILLEIENNSSYWKYSNRTEPFSRDLLKKFINQQDQDIFEVKQKRFVITNSKLNALGFIDLFDYTTNSAGVGIIIAKNYRNKGFAKEALCLLSDYSFDSLNLVKLHCKVAIDNLESMKLFYSCDFKLERDDQEMLYFVKLAKK